MKTGDFKYTGSTVTITPNTFMMKSNNRIKEQGSHRLHERKGQWHHGKKSGLRRWSEHNRDVSKGAALLMSAVTMDQWFLKAEVKQKPKSTRPNFGARKLTAHLNIMYNSGWFPSDLVRSMFIPHPKEALASWASSQNDHYRMQHAFLGVMERSIEKQYLYLCLIDYKQQSSTVKREAIIIQMLKGINIDR